VGISNPPIFYEAHPFGERKAGVYFQISLIIPLRSGQLIFGFAPDLTDYLSSKVTAKRAIKVRDAPAAGTLVLIVTITAAIASGAGRPFYFCCHPISFIAAMICAATWGTIALPIAFMDSRRHPLSSPNPSGSP
jgi:hypothetical protein